MKYIFSVLTIFILTSGFTCSKNQPGIEGKPREKDLDLLEKFEDKTNGVVCYRKMGYEGFSCVKVK